VIECIHREDIGDEVEVEVQGEVEVVESMEPQEVEVEVEESQEGEVEVEVEASDVASASEGSSDECVGLVEMEAVAKVQYVDEIIPMNTSDILGFSTTPLVSTTTTPTSSTTTSSTTPGSGSKRKGRYKTHRYLLKENTLLREQIQNMRKLAGLETQGSHANDSNATKRDQHRTIGTSNIPTSMVKTYADLHTFEAKGDIDAAILFATAIIAKLQQVSSSPSS